MEAKNTKDASRKEETSASEDTKRSPVRSFREGAVSASVFAREHVLNGDKRTFYSVSFTRSYKDENGKYQYAKNFDGEDLGKVVTVAQQAAKFIDGLQHPGA